MILYFPDPGWESNSKKQEYVFKCHSQTLDAAKEHFTGASPSERTGGLVFGNEDPSRMPEPPGARLPNELHPRAIQGLCQRETQQKRKKRKKEDVKL